MAKKSVHHHLLANDGAHFFFCQFLLQRKMKSTLNKQSYKDLTLFMIISMTSLLTHNVAHSTRHSFRPKTNNQPIKKFLSLAVSWVKVVKNGKILTFKVNFLCQKLSESFYFFSSKNIILVAHFLFNWHFLTIAIFKPLYFLKWRPIFDDFYSTDCKT